MDIKTIMLNYFVQKRLDSYKFLLIAYSGFIFLLIDTMYFFFLDFIQSNATISFLGSALRIFDIIFKVLIFGNLFVFLCLYGMWMLKTQKLNTKSMVIAWTSELSINLVLWIVYGLAFRNMIYPKGFSWTYIGHLGIVLSIFTILVISYFGIYYVTYDKLIASPNMQERIIKDFKTKEMHQNLTPESTGNEI